MSGDSPAVILYDSAGNPLAVSPDVVIPADTSGILVVGADGSTARFIRVDASGSPIVVGVGTAGTPAGGVLSIQGVSSGQPIPIDLDVSGLATESTLGTRASEVTLSAVKSDLDSINSVLSSPVAVTGPLTNAQLRAAVVPVSTASLPLPAGAATESTLASAKTDLDSILAKLDTPLSGVKTGTDRIPASPAQEHVTAASSHAVRLSDGTSFYKATTPSDTQHVSVASLPLPSGAATEATLSEIGDDIDAIETSLDIALSTRASEATLSAAKTDLDSILARLDVALSTRASQTTLALVKTDLDSILARLDVALSTRLADSTLTARINTLGQKTKATSTPVVLPSDQTVPISVGSLPLPAGAATEATLAARASETTLSSRLADATFIGRINTLGQKIMASSTPVVLASDQSSVPVTGPLTNAQLRASPVPVSFDESSLATETTLAAAKADLDSIAAKADVALSTIKTGTDRIPASPAQEHTTAVSPSSARLSDGTAFYKATTPSDTQPVSAVSLPLPTGAATETTLSGRLADSTFTTRINTLGQKDMAHSTPVVLPNDQVVPVSFSGGGLATETTLDSVLAQLDVALSTRASQSTLATLLADSTFTGRINTLGQKDMDHSTPVVLPSDQVVPVSFAGGGDLATETTLAEIATDTDNLDTPLSGLKTDLDSILTQLDVAFSTRASETTLASVLSKLDVALSTRSSESTLAAVKTDLDSILTSIDVSLSTRASESTLAEIGADIDTIEANFDVALSTRASQVTAASILAQLDVALSTRLAEATFTGRINTFGQKHMASSTPVVLADDQSAIPVTFDESSLATEATLSEIGADIDTIESNFDVALSTRASQATAASILAQLDVALSTRAAEHITALSPHAARLSDGAAFYTALTDTQLRASAVAVSGPLTDAQLRATAVPISAASLPLPTGAATEATLSTLATQATLALIKAKTDNLDAALSTRATEATLAEIALDTDNLDSPLSGIKSDLDEIALDTDNLALIKTKTDNLDVALSTRLADSTFTGRINTLGQKLMSASTPVVLASDQSTISVSLDTSALATESTLSEIGTDVDAIESALNVNLSTRATEATLAEIALDTDALAELDVALSTRASQTTLLAAVADLDEIALDTDNLASIKAKTDNLDVTLSGGSQKAIVRGGAKGTTTAADVTSTAEGLNNQALDVQIYHGGTAKDPTQVRALTNSDIVSAELTKWIGSTAPTVGQKTSANSLPVVIASDQSTVTISGTVTANVGTTNGLALDATLTGGTTKAVARGGAKGATTASDITSTAEGTDHQALDVQIYHGGTAKDPTAIRALTNADVVTAEVSKWIGSTAPTVGSKTSANSIPVVVASDQGAVSISGSVTANIGSSGSLALDATLTGGTAKAIARGGAKGTTAAADVTSTAEGLNNQALDVQIWHSGTAKDPTAIRALTSADVVTAVGAAASGAAVSGNPVLVGGTDGSNAQSFLTDTSGRQVSVGAAATGAPVAGNPVLVAASDGTNAQAIKSDTSGRPIVVGAAASAAAVVGNPVLIGGTDGTNARSILTDTSGRTVVALLGDNSNTDELSLMLRSQEDILKELRTMNLLLIKLLDGGGVSVAQSELDLANRIN